MTSDATGAEIELQAQLVCQRHRGPDAVGWFARGSAAIGQNRLAILDLDHGDPPLTNEDETVAAVLNGEIYNFRAIRERLSAGGHRFRTRCDTEVLVHLAEDLSPTAMAGELDGMFAFAVWDPERRRLVLGRDRFGKKPLYYYADGAGTFVFASEIKGVLACTAVPRELEPRAIPAYLTFGYVPTPLTFFRGIRSVPPGHVMTVVEGREPVLERYWRPPSPPPRDRRRDVGPSVDAAAAELRPLLRAAVERRLLADVPLGAFLSGGIDSSAVVATMSELSTTPVRTFTIGFNDTDGYDERPYARAVAQRYGTEHHEFVVSPDAVDLIEKLVWHHDQPFGDSSAIPTYLLNEVTRTEVTVALSGDGGDELFAGYERFAAALAVERYSQIPGRLRAAGRSFLGALPAGALRGRVGSAQRFAAAAEQRMPAAYLDWVSYIDDSTRRSLLADGSDWAQAEYAARWADTSGADPLDRLLDLNLNTYLLDDLLVKADRMSMAHGLEVRSPFLDVELATWAIGLAPQTKLRGLSLKRVLKHALRDQLPKEILARGKRGFGVPLDRWFRTDLLAYVRGTLGSPQARVRAYLDGAAIDAIIAEHLSGKRNRGGELWTLLTLEVFLRREGW